LGFLPSDWWRDIIMRNTNTPMARLEMILQDIANININYKYKQAKLVIGRSSIHMPIQVHCEPQQIHMASHDYMYKYTQTPDQ
jgi:hypothetical protein